MKHIIYSAVIAFFLTACSGTPVKDSTIADSVLDASSIETDDQNIEEPQFKFKENSWDFGTIMDGEKVEHTFKFKNVGQSDIVISSCKASCGCTIPEWPKEPIAPGAEGTIKVIFNSAGKSGNVSKDITILANTNPVKTMLQIRTFVDKPTQD